jgi:hypothetical protein
MAPFLATVTVKYKDHLKVVPYEGKNVYALRKQLGASVLHAKDTGGNRKVVNDATVKAYINGEPAEDADVVTAGEVLEFAEVPPPVKKPEPPKTEPA